MFTTKQMTKFGKLTTFGIIIVVLVTVGFSIWFFNTTKKITTYEECVKAGWLVRTRYHSDGLPLFPNKYECILWSGKSFEKYEYGEKTQEVQNEKELKIQEVKDMIPSRSINESEMQEWKNYTSKKLGISFRYPPDYIVVEVKETGTPTIGTSVFLKVLEDTPHNRQYAKTRNPDFDYDIPEEQKNVDIESGQGISFFKSVDDGFTQDDMEEYRSEKIADRSVYVSANFISIDSVVYRAEGLFAFDGVIFEKGGYLYQFLVQYFNSPESPRDDFYKIISTIEFQ